jgi:hypothetical protein
MRSTSQATLHQRRIPSTPNHKRNGLEAKPEVLNAFVKDIVTVGTQSITQWKPSSPSLLVNKDAMLESLKVAGANYIEKYPSYNILSSERHLLAKLPPLKYLPLLYKTDAPEVAVQKSFNRMMKRFALMNGQLLDVLPHVFRVGNAGVWKPNSELGDVQKAQLIQTIHQQMDRFMAVHTPEKKAGDVAYTLTREGHRRKKDYLNWDIFESLPLAQDVHSNRMTLSQATKHKAHKRVGYVSPQSVKRAEEAMERFFESGKESFGHPRNHKKHR